MDARTVMWLDLVAAVAVGEVSMPCKRFSKTKYEFHAHSVICQWPASVKVHVPCQSFLSLDITWCTLI